MSAKTPSEDRALHGTLPETMRAMVVRAPGAPDALQLERVPLPEVRAFDVLIRVEACGVCFHDVVTRNGVLRRGVEMPVVPGHEVAGVVVAIGPAVRDFRPGDRVATVPRRHICGRCRYCRTDHESSCLERENLGDKGLNGGYAEYVAVGEDNVARMPEAMPFAQAAIVGCAVGTELNAIRDVARVQMGERVLVTGAGGGIGIHGVQLARLTGAEVFAVTTTADKVERIRAAGAHHVLLAKRDGDFSREVNEITGGEGADVAVDNVGSVLFDQTRRSLGMGGRWIFVGQLNGDFVRLNPAQFFLRNLSILSAKSTSRRQLNDALALVQRGAVTPVIETEMPLEAAAEAHRLVEAGRLVGRVVLRP